MQDSYNKIEVRQAINVTRQTNSSSAVVGNIIDLSGYDSCLFVISYGNLTDADATFAVTLDEGDASNLSGSNSVAAGDMLGTLAAAGATFSDDNKVRKLGYKGAKRYVRLTVTPTNNDSGNLDISAVVVLSDCLKQPTP